MATTESGADCPGLNRGDMAGLGYVDPGSSALEKQSRQMSGYTRPAGSRVVDIVSDLLGCGRQVMFRLTITTLSAHAAHLPIGVSDLDF